MTAGPGLFTVPGVEFRVELALGDIEDRDDVFAYDTPPADYDSGALYTGSFELYWIDISSRLVDFRTTRGRDTFNETMRPGSFTVALINDDGVFNPEFGEIPIGDLSLRPGRFVRVSGRVNVEDAPPLNNVFRFADQLDGTNVVSTDFDIDTLDGGFTMTGRIATEIVPAAPGARIVNVWSGVSTNRKMQMFMRDNSSLRFQVQTTGGGISLTTGPLDLTGAGLAFVAAYAPGGELTFAVQGEPLLTNPGPMDPLQVSTHPLTIASRADLIEGATGWLGLAQDLVITPTAGAAIRLAGEDVGTDGPLDGVSWTEGAGGHTWDASGAVSLLGDTNLNEWLPMITGRIDAIAERYSDAAAAIATEFRCTDLMTAWQRDDPPALEIPRPSESSSERILYLLDEARFPIDALPPGQIDPGLVDVQSSTIARPYLEEMQKVATAEGGAFYVDRVGLPRFRQRDWLEASPDAGTVQFSVGGPFDEIEIVNASEATWDSSRVINDVQLSRRGGEAILAESSESQARYGRRTLRRFDLENQNDADVLFLADRAVTRFRYDSLRIDALTLFASTLDAAVDLITLELGMRIRVNVRTLRGWQYTFDAWVQRIEHSGEIGGDWTTRVRIDNVDRTDPEFGGAYSSAFDDGYSPDTTP